MASQNKVKNYTSTQFQNVRIQNDEMYFITDTEKLYVGKDATKIILNPTPTKETINLENVDNVKQIPFDFIDSNIELGDSDEKIPTQNAVKKYVDNKINSSTTDIIIDCGEF
jgi:hypothetical protein